MKLQARFMQLPVCYDADRLSDEIGALPESAWLPHPQRFAGNDFLPLVSVDGDPLSESFAGPMRPTPYLERCSYLVDVLASIGVTIGRTRFMRLSGHAEVTPHIDAHYYWRERMRVHVPIVTQPTVRFSCGDQEVNMKAGECWIFDTWSRHRVINDAVEQRIHLVIDTVGGAGFWDLLAGARAHTVPQSEGWAPRLIEPYGSDIATLHLEKFNIPIVMTPWELREHLNFLRADANQDHPIFADVDRILARLSHAWHGLWSEFGDGREGWPLYTALLEQTRIELKSIGAARLPMRSGAEFMPTIHNMVFHFAVGSGPRQTPPQPDTAPGEDMMGRAPAAHARS